MKKSDQIGIVLGGGISKRNKIPYDSKTRIRKALKLLKKNKIQKLILSGKCSYGVSKKTEAKLFQDFLIKRGINNNKLLLEENSRDTIGNAVYSKKIVIKHKLPKNIVVITSNYHLSRALMIFKHVFGNEYNITGVSSRPILPHFFLKKFKEWEKKEVNRLLLLKVPIGNHVKAEKLIKKHLPMYKK